MHHGLHRKFYNLAILGAWNVCNLHDARRDVARRRVVANLLSDAFLEVGIEPEARAQLHEQDDARIAGLYYVRNPEKLSHLEFVTELTLR